MQRSDQPSSHYSAVNREDRSKKQNFLDAAVLNQKIQSISEPLSSGFSDGYLAEIPL